MADLEQAEQKIKEAGEKINQTTKVGKEHTEEKVRDTEAKTEQKLK